MKNATRTLLTILILAMTFKGASAYNAPREQWLGTGQLNGFMDIPNQYYRPTMAYDPTIEQFYSPGYVDGYYRNWFDRYSNWMRKESPVPVEMFRTPFVQMEDDLTLNKPRVLPKREDPRLHSTGFRVVSFNTNVRRGGVRSMNRVEFKPIQMRRLSKSFDYTPRSLEDGIGNTIRKDITLQKRVYDQDEEEGEDGLYGFNETAYNQTTFNQTSTRANVTNLTL